MTRTCTLSNIFNLRATATTAPTTYHATPAIRNSYKQPTAARDKNLDHQKKQIRWIKLVIVDSIENLSILENQLTESFVQMKSYLLYNPYFSNTTIFKIRPSLVLSIQFFFCKYEIFLLGDKNRNIFYHFFKNSIIFDKISHFKNSELQMPISTMAKFAIADNTSH